MSLKSLALLSHKGGVGKTIIAVNLAVHLANIGKNVCLLDTDFHGPSLMTFFKPQVSWLNDYLLGTEHLEECLQDVSTSRGLSGKLFTGFADPSADSIQKVIRIDQKASIVMLQNLMRLKKRLLDKPYEIEYLIIDCSPGTGYSTVNVMLVVDSSLFIIKLSNADIFGTSQMIAGLYQQLKSRTLVLANLIPHEAIKSHIKKVKIQQLVEQRFARDIGDKVVKFLGWIPTDTSLQQLEFDAAVKTLQEQESSRVIFTLDNPDHVFSTTLVELIPIIFEEST
ncbi:MAG: MinD/ParA family protein [Candidatus Hodarchaeota archaeon]